MKILLLCTFERTGGAAVAASRLMKALRKHGIDAKMLVRDKQTDDENVVSVNTSPWKRKINFIRFVFERLVIFGCNRFNRKDLFAVSIANTGTNVSKHPLLKDADVVHLHWTNQGFLSLNDISELTKISKPFVWTMHDQWAGSGICHYVARSCNGFVGECGNCPLLQSSLKNDLSHRVFLEKKRLFLNSPISFVGCSRWIAEYARSSALLRNAFITSIPNPIDTELFSPRNSEESRRKLNLPLTKKLILFTSAKISDERKGMSYFIEACRRLKDDGFEAEVVLMGGKASESLLNSVPLTTHVLGYLHAPTDIASAYSACDVFVIPSLADNLPNTVMESMACGTPCAGFNVGGIPEMIDHKQNGYVAEYRNAEDLATGIEWVLKNREKLNLSAACIKKVHANYSESIVVDKYVNIYTDLLQRNGKIF